MKYRKLGTSGIDVSVIAQGTWAMGNDFFGDVDKDLAIKCIRTSVDCGVNLIDTAPAYGDDYESEKVVGEAIKGIRDKVVLATKLGVLRFHGQNYVKCSDPNVMRIELEQSLRTLKTDYIDVYQIHWPDHNNPLEPALEQLVKFKEEGKIRAIGVSNFNVEQIKIAKQVADIACVQPPMNLLNRSSFDNGIMDCCINNNIGVLTYGSLGGGILTGKMERPEIAGNELRGAFYSFYSEEMWPKCQELIAILRGIADERGVSVAEVSINWVLAQRGVSAALLGAVKPEDAIENAKAADWSLSDDEIKTINDNYAKIMC